MSSTIFTAQQFDERKAARRRNLVLIIIVAAVALAVLGWTFRNLPYEHRVENFFEAIERKDFETAYGLWLNDREWKQHPEQHKAYPFHEFYLDWGPSGEYGPIRKHKIVGSRSRGSGVIVAVRINDIVATDRQARVWVEKRDKTMTFSPW